MKSRADLLINLLLILVIVGALLLLATGEPVPPVG